MAGIIVTKTKAYKMTIFVFSILQYTAFFAWIFILQTENVTFIGLGLTLYASFGGALLPTMMELLVEVSFPVAEEVPGGLFSLLYQVFGTILNIVITQLIGDGGKESILASLYFLFVICILCALLSLLGKEDLRRRRYERDGSFLVSDEEHAKEINEGMADSIMPTTKSLEN